MTSAAPASGLHHVTVLVALTAIGALIVLPAFGLPPEIPPYGPDNVFALELGTYSDPGLFFSNAEQVWRPLAYTTLWLQYQASGLDISVFFSLNIALWIACAALVYAAVYVHTHLVLAGAAAAFITLTDERMFSALILIIERQTIMACLFGLLALLAAYRWSPRGRRELLALVGIFVLLLLAALSKEFGLAFAFGVAAIGLLARRRELLAVGFGAVLAYGIGRGVLTGLDVGSGVAASNGFKETTGDSGLCETMGYGANPRDICYGDLSVLDQLAQFAWNVGASFVAIFFPSVISDSGYLLVPNFLATSLGGPEDYAGFAVLGLVLPSIVTALAIVAFLKRSAVALPLLVVIAANALLCFQYYRPRLIVVGMVALHIAAGIGIAPAREILKRQLRRLDGRVDAVRTAAPALLAMAFLAVGVAVATRSVALADDLEGGRGSHAVRDPCDATAVYDVKEMPNLLKKKFGLPGTCPPS